MSTWNLEQIPDLSGRIAIVTGANSGIGYETARVLAQRGAEVVLACRSEERANDAMTRMRADALGPVRFMALDLANLESVARFASAFRDGYSRLDLLINNAGVMFPPESQTHQGAELQFGVNHLGHFALSAQLVDRLAATRGARVVTVSSLAHRFGRIHFDDVHFRDRTYRTLPTYGQSKLANLLFALELQRWFERHNLPVLSLAAHPGWTATELQRHSRFIRTMTGLLAMKPIGGALPTLRAALDPNARGGEYYGPSGFLEARGRPVLAKVSRAAQNQSTAERLWALSEEETRVAFHAPANASARARA